MNIDHYKRLSIELHNDEAESLREILRLAYVRLHTSPPERMRGIPIERQAGLVGPELYRVKGMLEKLGKAVGLDLPIDPPASNEDGVIAIVVLSTKGGAA